MNNLPSKRFLIIGAFLLLAGASLLAFWLISQSQLTAELTIEAAPSGSSIKLNNKGVREGTIKVRPGSYTVTVSRDGFSTESQFITVSKDQNYYVGLVLASNSPGTADWFETHRQDALKAEGITGKNLDQTSRILSSKFPIVNDLPFIDQEYRIDYGRSQKEPDNPEAVAIYVTYYSEDGKQQATEWLESKGYTPENLEIIFESKPFSF